MINKTPTYWQNKIAAWLNEPVVKVFDIKNRDENAKKIKESLKVICSTVDNKKVRQATYIASGLTRAALPYDDSKLESIVLKHPLVEKNEIKFSLQNKECQSLINDIKNLLETDLAYLSKELSEEEKAKEIFNYLFFAFNKQLRKNDIGDLGPYWDILPADTRMPDHPMWHHFGMTSAIYSSLERNENDSKENLSLVVYSITPVQDFIGKARKLRDYWTGSVILSYLAFSGITAVMENLGPDHILYPSLQNQSLVEDWLVNKNKGLEDLLKEKDALQQLNEKSQSIASFPNKFVFLCNNQDVQEMCNLIESRIKDVWEQTSNIVKEYVMKITDSKDSEEFNRIWDNTITDYWKLSWAATNFATINNKSELEQLLPTKKWKNEFETMEKFNSCFDEKNKVFPNYDASNLYGTSHSLVQGLLAAGKTKPTSIKPIQEGEKCPLCGEHEVLNNSKTDIKAAEYNKNVTQFWDKLRKVLNPENSNSQIGKNERLCAVCTIKRLLPLKNVFKDDKHILYKTLVKSYDENFPSTTEMSAWEFLKTLPIDKRKVVAEQLHSNEFDSDDEKIKSLLDGSKGYETKYYAFLLMDGDKMGDLINGESIETSWNDVINIKNKASTVFSKEDFANQKRTINPALHSMISDSLNNFARYGVQPIINQCEGKLIYAGGDDVCAILPLSTAFKAADEIRQVYQYSFAKVTSEGSKQIESVDADTKKIVVHLGHSNKQDETKISLSGAIIIAHHKTPLKEVITQAHAVLDGVAKEKSGRNSLAIRLDKRSGGSRDTWFKWEDKNVFSNDANLTCKTSFEEIIKIAQKKELSTSLLYKIESLKASIEPLADDIEKNKDLIIKLFEYEIAHSGYKTEANKMAVHLAGLCVKHSKMSDTDDSWYNPEVAIIANFMAKSGIKIEEGEKNDE